MKQFTLSSNDLKPQMVKKHVFHDFGAGGENISPALSWSDAPEGTKSFLITCHDPDAPSPSGWWHWCICNISSELNELKAGVNPDSNLGTQALNDYGIVGYGGACPPPGDPYHAYHFTIYALDTEKIEVKNGVMPAMVIFLANAHVLAKATITSYYRRD